MNLAHFGYQSRERRLTAETESTHARILLLIYYTVHIWVGISRQTKNENKNSLSDCSIMYYYNINAAFLSIRRYNIMVPKYARTVVVHVLKILCYYVFCR